MAKRPDHPAPADAYRRAGTISRPSLPGCPKPTRAFQDPARYPVSLSPGLKELQSQVEAADPAPGIGRKLTFMGLTDSLCYYNTLLISQCSYLGIFMLMALESMVFPIPSELVMPFAGFLIFTGQFERGAGDRGQHPGVHRWAPCCPTAWGCWENRWCCATAATCCSIHITWNGPKNSFDRHGGKTIFISRFIPVVRHLISIPAGLARMSLIPFILYTVAGATLWNGFLTYLGMRLKENWWVIQRYTHILDYFVVAGLIGVVVYLVWKLKRARKPA